MMGSDTGASLGGSPRDSMTRERCASPLTCVIIRDTDRILCNLTLIAYGTSALKPLILLISNVIEDTGCEGRNLIRPD